MADLEKCYVPIMGMAGVAVLVGFAYLYFMRYFAIPIVWFTLASIWVILAMLAGSMYWNYAEITKVVEYTPQLSSYDQDKRNQSIALAAFIITLLLFAGHSCMIIFLRKHVDIAARILSLAAESMIDMPYLVFYPIGNVLVLLLTFLLFLAVSVLLSSAGTIVHNYQYGVAEMDYSDELQRVFLFWLFAFFWITAFIEATGFMVLAFCVCMWFFSPRPADAEDGDSEHRELPAFPLCRAIKMTVLHHLGTLATGSLIIAIIRIIRVCLEYIEQKQKQLGLADKPWAKYILCILRCCLWCLEKCVRWLTAKVYIMTCIKGTWFCSSLWSVALALFSMSAYIAVAEFTSAIMLFLGKLAIGLGAAAIGAYIMGSMELTSIIFPTLLTGIIGFTVASMFMVVYDMAIDSMLMCFCEAKRNPTRGICVPRKLESYMGEAYKKNQPTFAPKKDPSTGEVDMELVPINHAANDPSGLDPVLIQEMNEKFARYDLDSSGTINSTEELQQLMTNLYFAMSSKGIQKIRPDKIATRVQSAGDMSTNNWTFQQWVAWCKVEFPEICEYQSGQ